jgi:hypothetical protein
MERAGWLTDTFFGLCSGSMTLTNPLTDPGQPRVVRGGAAQVPLER